MVVGEAHPYTVHYINRHAGTPNKTKTKSMMSLDYSSVGNIGSRVVWVSMKEISSSDPALRRRLLDIVVRIWSGGEVPQQWKDAIIMVLTKRRIGQSAATTGASRWKRTPARYC